MINFNEYARKTSSSRVFVFCKELDLQHRKKKKNYGDDKTISIAKHVNVKLN